LNLHALPTSKTFLKINLVVHLLYPDNLQLENKTKLRHWYSLEMMMRRKGRMNKMSQN
jgi:hypothetical protein